MPTPLSLHFSPCPNDTFIFAGLAKRAVPGGELQFEVNMADVEELNGRAIRGEADVIKVSYHAFLSLVEDYVLLDAGSALGEGVGPLLIAREGFDLKDIGNKKIAIPGEFTTANLLLKLAYGKGLHSTPLVFSEIEDAVLSGAFDAGLIIHENRFTYQKRGLTKIADMGEYWEALTALPIPLGGIIAKRSLGTEKLIRIENLIRESIHWARKNPDAAIEYIRKYAQEMDDAVMKEHIGLYVTEYSYSLGEKGRRAIEKLFDLASEKGLIPECRNKPFLKT